MTGTATPSAPDGRPGIETGTKVEVRDRFQGTWARGFEVAGADAEGYQIRRLSDASILPTPFDRDDVRRERRRHGSFWWH